MGEKVRRIVVEVRFEQRSCVSKHTFTLSSYYNVGYIEFLGMENIKKCTNK